MRSELYSPSQNIINISNISNISFYNYAITNHGLLMLLSGVFKPGFVPV